MNYGMLVAGHTYLLPLLFHMLQQEYAQNLLHLCLMQLDTSLAKSKTTVTTESHRSAMHTNGYSYIAICTDWIPACKYQFMLLVITTSFDNFYLLLLVYLQLLPQQTHLNFLLCNNSHCKDFLEFHGVCSDKYERKDHAFGLDKTLLAFWSRQIQDIKPDVQQMYTRKLGISDKLPRFIRTSGSIF